jgi:DNA-3-methyladenine glycosylase
LSEWDEIDTPIARPRVLDRAEIPVDTALLAQFLIGKMLVRVLAEGVAGGRIVETEAYGIGDPAGHAYRGITLRNRALFLERGHAYVYLAYGSSFMLNVSSEQSGVGAGVLTESRCQLRGVGLKAHVRAAILLKTQLSLPRKDRISIAISLTPIRAMPAFRAAPGCGGGLTTQ